MKGALAEVVLTVVPDDDPDSPAPKENTFVAGVDALA